MTVIDRLRSALPGSDDVAVDARTWGPGWRRALLLGLATGLLSAALVLGPVLLAWGDAATADDGADTAVRVGASLWLLVGGAHLSTGAGLLTLTPLFAFGLLVVLARVGAREAMVEVSTDGEHWYGTLPRPLAAAVASWWAGYLVVVATAWGIAASGPLPPRPWTVLLPGVVVPVLGAWLALRPVVLDDPDVLGPRLGPVLPEVLRRAVAPGLAGAAALVALGTLVVGVAVGISWPEVATLHRDLGAQGVGALVLALAQVGAAPNLGIWVLGVFAGPGFTVVDGAAVTWSGAESGLLPLVPVLAALPQPGPFPVVLAPVLLLVLAGVGAWVARRALGAVARLSRLRTKLAVATLACAVAALTVGALDLLGGGSAGQFRLASVGVPTGALTAGLFAALLVGAVVHVLRDAWRLRR